MRCWAEINIQNLYENIKEIEKVTSKDKIIAVLKADAYGHGMEKICEVLLNVGIKSFAVATVEEALKLKEINSQVFVIILGPIQNGDMGLILENDIYFTLTDLDEIKYLEANKQKSNVFIKIDSGMGRVGFQKNELEELISLIKQCKYVNTVGIFSHLSSSDSNEEYTKFQENNFREMSNRILFEIPTIKYRHLLNSFGILKFQKSVYDFIRIGIIAYGGVSEKDTSPYNFKPVMSLYAKISYIKTLNEDTFISYGNTYKAKKGDTIGTVSIGYADGVRRDLSNKGYVYYKGNKCDIIGRVCMDQLLILIPQKLSKEAKKGDTVEIFGENINVVEVADLCNTISYEILCGISQRVPRIYK